MLSYNLGVMVAKRIKKSEKPRRGFLFNEEQMLYISKGFKQIKWGGNWIDQAIIYVPTHELEEADNNIIVIHLRNKFGFHVEGVTEAPQPDHTIFKAELRAKIIREIEEEKPFLRIGDRFTVQRLTGIILEITSLNEERQLATYKHTGTIASDSVIGYKTIKELIKNYSWQRI